MRADGCDTVCANDIDKKESGAALENIRMSGNVPIITLTPQEKFQWKRVLLKMHTRAEAIIDAALLQSMYTETGFDRKTLWRAYGDRVADPTRGAISAAARVALVRSALPRARTARRRSRPPTRALATSRRSNRPARHGLAAVRRTAERYNPT